VNLTILSPPSESNDESLTLNDIEQDTLPEQTLAGLHSLTSLTETEVKYCKRKCKEVRKLNSKLNKYKKRADTYADFLEGNVKLEKVRREKAEILVEFKQKHIQKDIETIFKNSGMNVPYIGELDTIEKCHKRIDIL
jgi:hypothetical protein